MLLTKRCLLTEITHLLFVNETVCLMCVNKDFVQRYTRTNLKAMSVSVFGAKLWSELYSNLRNIKTILLFKKMQRGCTTHVRITYLSILGFLALKKVVRLL